MVLCKLYHRAKVSVDQTKEGFCPGGLMSYTRLQTVIASPVHVIEHYFISFHIIFICSEKHIIKLTQNSEQDNKANKNCTHSCLK